MFIVFVGMIIFLKKTGTEEYAEKNKVLKNGVVFEGTVTDIKISRNHSFGILNLNIVNSNVQDFSKKLEKGIYPYQIKGKQAEIYLPIFAERQIGDSVKVISDKEIIYYNGKKSKDEGDVYIITNSADIAFVKENTIFK
ncbi:hypothetical protein SAMN05421769_1765 [Chryseobacterium scophthalmum]|uniref:Uncharacterized protein n=2 Tax=Chryseobacterium scophthalmum TaxID=59733 RepID=A0A1N6G0K3_9FLAO|nr:hypothetical protein SAMN05421769_1765 [Chryseobacterium scophthalmum]